MKSLRNMTGIYHLIKVQGIVLLLLFSVSNQTFAHPVAEPTHVSFVVSRTSEPYQKVVAVVQAALFNNHYSFSEIHQSAINDIENALVTADIIVTVGAGAAAQVMSLNPTVQVIASLITDSAFASLAEKHYGSTKAAFSAGVSLICLDQPVQRSIKLAKVLMPEARSAGLMLGPASHQNAGMLSSQVKKAGMVSEIAKVSATENPILIIEPVLKKSDIFIPVPDSRLINIATAKWILQLSYRYRVPVIAYSQAYLNGGALAAIYSSPENVGRQTADLIIEGKRISGNGGRHRPAYFSIEFNSSVAAYLGVDLKPKQYYLDWLGAE